MKGHVLVIATLLLAAAPSASAAPCPGKITEIIVEDGSPGGQGFYIDDRSEGDLEVNLWLYRESNGRDGLQSGGNQVPIVPDETPLLIFYDSCITHGPEGPDALLPGII